MANFDVLRNLIDMGISYNIMYVDLFEKLGLKKETLSPYVDFDLPAFNGAIIQMWSFMDLW